MTKPPPMSFTTEPVDAKAVLVVGRDGIAVVLVHCKHDRAASMFARDSSARASSIPP